MIDARQAALRILLSLSGTLYIQSALDIFLNNNKLSERDRGLCTELVYGYLRNELRINFILGHFFKGGRNLPQEMIIALGISLYSILFLTKIPNYASVNWSVEHIKNKFNLKLSKVANGVLRNIIRQQDELNQIKFYSANKLDNDFEAYALFYSMPLWIAKIWKKSFNADIAINLMHKFSHKPKIGIRLNLMHNGAETIKKELLKSDGMPLGLYGIMFDTGQAPNIINDMKMSQVMQDGICTYQSPGSILIIDALERLGNSEDEDTEHAIKAKNECGEKNNAVAEGRAEFDTQSGLKVSVMGDEPKGQNMADCLALKNPIWDMCAGQGGKTCALLERGYRVELATDVNFSRLKLLAANIIRLNLNMPVIAMVDKNHNSIQKWTGTILIDAPCSGLGILHRRPDIKRVKTEEDILGYVLVQKNLLLCAWDKLQKSGTIVYITCTINPLENHEQIRNFLAEHADASLVGEWQTGFNDLYSEGMYVASICKNV